MLKLLLGTLLVGLVSSCAMEKQESSGVLVDQNSDVEVPEGLTAWDIDLNKDGVVNIQDLVIASKFIGQDVVKPTVASASDGSDPCQNIRDEDVVEGDNADMTEIFSAPNGTYVYALVAFQIWNLTDPKCFALRLSIDDNMLPTAVVAKSVKNGKLSSPLESPPLTLQGSGTDPNPRKIPAGGSKYYNAPPRTIYRLGHFCKEYGACYTSNWDIKVNSDFIFDYDISSYPEEQRSYLLEWNVVKIHKYYGKRLSQSGIPIGNGRTISRIAFSTGKLYAGKDANNYNEGQYTWEIYAYRDSWRFTVNEIFADTNRDLHRDEGVYIKMLPAKVRQRYFPEDIK